MEKEIQGRQLSEARETVEVFCRAWFERREAGEAANLLSDKVSFIGTGQQEYAHGRKEMEAYIKEDIGEMLEPFACILKVLDEELISPDIYHLSFDMKLTNSLYSWHLRGFFMLLYEEERWRIRSVHFAEPSVVQQKDEHYPNTLVLENIARQRQEILNDSLAGGMMGGYIDEGFPFYFINRQMLSYLGYENEEEFVKDIGGMISNCMHPEDRDAVDAEVRRQLQNSGEYTVEYRMRKKDASYIWVHDTGRVIETENGRSAIASVCVDITEAKYLQERSRELYERELSYFAQLVSAEGVIQGKINVTKNVLESYLSSSNVTDIRIGDSYEKAIGFLADSVVDPLKGQEVRDTLQREKVIRDYEAGKTEYHFDFLCKRKKGNSIFWANSSLRSFLNPETGDIILFFYTFDVTEQKLQEQLLKRIAELDYELIAEVDINRNHHRLISIAPELAGTIPEVGEFSEIARNHAAHFMDEAGAAEYLKKLDIDYIKDQLEKRDVYVFMAAMKSPKGDKRVKRMEVFYINRELGRVCITRTDVTEIVRQEQRQKEDLAAALTAAKQANAAKTDFLSRMSHEIRTPMNAIIGMTAIAMQTGCDNAQVADCLSKIGISSRFLLSLINDILDMSRVESGKMLLKNEKIPTEEFINGINAICFSQADIKGVEYECIADPVLDDYYVGDAMKLQQVLVNIVGNAIKFTPEGGKVTFSVTQRKRYKNCAELRFVVNDTGVGMDEEFLPHIFEPFSQESTGTTALFGGTGLGLAISKSIVDLMDGRITVRSIKGIGTEFIVDVKLEITKEELLRRRKKEQMYNFSHLKTLVVDDDVTACVSVVATLKEIGITGEWVDSGRKAVERVKELWANHKYYDMILIDWKMPDMDGIETARRIRSIVGSEVTIIIMTAYDWISIEHEAKLAGVNLLMSKPMFRSSLISAFTKALGEKEEEQKKEEITVYDFTGRRLLLVEDNALNTEVAKMLLENKGFTVETAENGLRAMELFAKTEKGYYDGILMDIRMPVMDGLTATRNIRNLSNADAREIPIIAMTANAFDEDVEKSKAAGMNAHLEKPIDPSRLYQTLYHFIVGKEE